MYYAINLPFFGGKTNRLFKKKIWNELMFDCAVAHVELVHCQEQFSVCGLQVFKGAILSDACFLSSQRISHLDIA